MFGGRRGWNSLCRGSPNSVEGTYGFLERTVPPANGSKANDYPISTDSRDNLPSTVLPD